MGIEADTNGKRLSGFCGCVQDSRPKWCALVPRGTHRNPAGTTVMILGTDKDCLERWREPRYSSLEPATRRGAIRICVGCQQMPSHPRGLTTQRPPREGKERAPGKPRHTSPIELAGRVRAAQSNGKDGESDDEKGDRAMQRGRTRKGLDSLPSRQRVRRVQGVLRSCHPAT